MTNEIFSIYLVFSQALAAIALFLEKTSRSDRLLL